MNNCVQYFLECFKNNTFNNSLVLFENKLWSVKQCYISETLANTLIVYATAKTMFKYFTHHIACEVCPYFNCKGYKLQINNNCHSICKDCADEIVSGVDISN